MVVYDGGLFLENHELFWPEIKQAYSSSLDASPLKIAWKTSTRFERYGKNNFLQRHFRNKALFQHFHYEIFVFILS